MLPSLVVLILDHILQSWMTTVYHWTLWVLIVDPSMTTYHHCVWFLTVLIGTLQRPVDHRSSDFSYNNSLMKFSSVTHEISECECQGPAYSVCTQLYNFNIALIFLPMFSVYRFLKIFNMNISHFHSCTTVLFKYCVF